MFFNSEGFIAGILPTAQAAYYCRDAQGNITSVWRVDAGYPYQGSIYYADGLLKSKSFSNSFQPYRYSGKELLKMHGYDCYDYGARHSYTALGRFTTMDPLAEIDYETSPYALCKGNPVKFIDPDGRAPLYNESGEYITNKGGYTGNVYVLKGNDVVALQNADLSAKSYSAIYTDILKKGNFDISNLQNECVSVIKGSDKFNEPQEKAKFLQTHFSSDNEYKTTVNQSSKNIELLNTVENLQNAIGVHEMEGHGENKLGSSTNTHHMVYEMQMQHSTWDKTTDQFKKEMTYRYNIYIQKEKH